jgi:hypothetical protein
LEEELQKIISPDGFAIVCGSRAHLGKAFFSIMNWGAQGPTRTYQYEAFFSKLLIFLRRFKRFDKNFIQA